MLMKITMEIRRTKENLDDEKRLDSMSIEVKSPLLPTDSHHQVATRETERGLEPMKGSRNTAS